MIRTKIKTKSKIKSRIKTRIKTRIRIKISSKIRINSSSNNSNLKLILNLPSRFCKLWRIKKIRPVLVSIKMVKKPLAVPKTPNVGNLNSQFSIM